MNAASRLSPRPWFAIVPLICLLLIGAVTVSAQSTPTPIIIGENQTAEVIDTSSAVQYSLFVAAPQSVEVQVLAISPGYAPAFRVLGPSGIVILDAPNPGTQTIAQGTPNLSSPGTYLIEVGTANNAPGQFLISVQLGSPLEPPQALILGQPLAGTVDEQTSRQAYAFTASESDVLLLTVRTDDPAIGAVIALRDAESGDTFGLSNAQLGGVRYRILTGRADYLLEVMHSGDSEPKTFTVCLETESGTVTCPAGGAAIIPPAQTVEASDESSLQPSPTLFLPPTIDPNGGCTVTAGIQSVNVRSGPSTGFSVIAQLAPNTSAPVIGRLADNSWLQINVGVIGWVSASVVTLGGNCAGVAVVVPPAPPPTQLSNPTQTPSITITPTVSNTPAPSLTPTITNTPNPLLQITAIVRPTRADIDLIAEPWGTPIINGTVYLDVRVMNNGSDSAGAFTVGACIVGAAIDPNGFPMDYCQSQPVASLGGNTGTILTFSTPPGIGGQQTVYTSADLTTVIAETDESNNTTIRTMDFH